jgi:ankyrin repeat protein
MAADYGPLHIAAGEGDIEFIRQAIASGQDLSPFDELGKTPLHYAVGGGHLEVARTLLEGGANVNAHDPSVISDTPLAEIAGNGSLEIVELLLQAGADPTIPGWMQLCALDRAKDRKRGDGPKIYQLMCKAAKHLPARHRAEES